MYNFLRHIIFTIFFLFTLLFNTFLLASELRVIKVNLVYDSFLDKNIEWHKNIRERFDEINKFYTERFDIHWELSRKTKFNFERPFNTISDVFSKYKDKITALNVNNEGVVICILSEDLPGKGIAGVFSNLVMISDSSYLKSKNSGVIIAHELGHLFGAWHTRRKDDLMYIRGARNYKAGTETNSIIKLMRNYDFKESTLLKNRDLLKRISKLYKRFHARSEADPTVRRYSLNEVNPVARLYTDQGISFLKYNQYNQAIEFLEDSTKFDAGWGRTRMYLAKAYFGKNRYQESFTELTRAVFFGANPDKIFEEKLKKKFEELKKIDPEVINPFIEKY